MVDTICTYTFLNNTSALSFAGTCARCICRSCIDVVSLERSDTNNIIIGVKKVTFVGNMALGNHELWQVNGVRMSGRLSINNTASFLDIVERFHFRLAQLIIINCPR